MGNICMYPRGFVSTSVDGEVDLMSGISSSNNRYLLSKGNSAVKRISNVYNSGGSDYKSPEFQIEVLKTAKVLFGDLIWFINNNTNNSWARSSHMNFIRDLIITVVEVRPAVDPRSRMALFEDYPQPQSMRVKRPSEIDEFMTNPKYRSIRNTSEFIRRIIASSNEGLVDLIFILRLMYGEEMTGNEENRAMLTRLSFDSGKKVKPL